MNESNLLLALRLKKVKVLLQTEKYNCAIRMFDLIMTTQDDYIKLRMFFGCVYTMQKMYGDAFQAIVNAQHHLSRKIMGKELIKRRVLASSSDIGVLNILPDLCLQNILSKM